MSSIRESQPPLHPIERAVLQGLAKSGADEWIDIEKLSSQADTKLDQTRRALEWLKEKGLLITREKESLSYSLGEEGKRIVRSGLPERRLVKFLEKKGGAAELSDAAKELGVEFSVALGKGKTNGWITASGNRISLTESYSTKTAEEQVLEKLSSLGALGAAQLTPADSAAIASLSKRLKGLVQEARSKEIFAKLTDKGRGYSTKQVEEIDALTSQVLRSGLWKTKAIRALDVLSPAPHMFAGRKHPMRLFMDEVREIFVSLGFEEILGPVVQSAFWNFDALFIPQKHSAREMQDTFYVDGAKADLSKIATREVVKGIKEVHETGGRTGSLGWQYLWTTEEAERVVLRTHTTAVTISYLAQYKPENARVFTVGKVFRNEKSNYKNNPEFSQIEGVMVGKELNLRNLIYIITKFYSKLGFEKIKFWPTYFPYTEPSLQTMAYYKSTNAWMELGGMGVFRPEVTLPLGVKNPVLAWGLGLDRLVMLRYDIKDIRSLFGSNLGWLRDLRLH